MDDRNKGEKPKKLQDSSPAASSSSHSRPPSFTLSPAIKLKIFCLLLPDPSRRLFSVSIDNDQTINDLKDAIKLKKVNDLKDIDVDKLILYKVLMPAAVFVACSS